MNVPPEVVRSLVSSGYAPTTIALTLGIPYDDIWSLLDETERRRWKADDGIIKDAMRVLVSRVLEEALYILDEGTPQLKIQLISRFGGQMAKIFGQHEDDTLSNLRDDFTQLMGEMRQGVVSGPDAPDSPLADPN